MQDLCDNALNLVRSTSLLVNIAEQHDIVPVDIRYHVPIFLERCRAVASYKGPAIAKLRQANPYPVADGDSVALSHVELAWNLGIRVYVVLLEADAGSAIARQWRICGDLSIRELSLDNLEKHWAKVVADLLKLPKFGGALLEMQIRKELARALESEPPLSPVDARNKFCFEEWQRDETKKTIRTVVNKRPEWEQLNADSSVDKAITAWSKACGIEQRKSGPGRKRVSK